MLFDSSSQSYVKFCPLIYCICYYAIKYQSVFIMMQSIHFQFDNQYLQYQNSKKKQFMNSPPFRYQSPNSLKTHLSTRANQCASNRSVSESSPLGPSFLHDFQEVYLSFKQRLLRAMQTHDPLAILQSGIFQEFQQNVNISLLNNSGFPGQRSTESRKEGKISDFESVLRTYKVQNEGKITQLERRSLSCQRINKVEHIKRRLQQERNIQFVLFSNCLRQLQDCQIVSGSDGQLLNIEVKKQQADIKICQLSQQICLKQQQNRRLTEKIIQMQRKIEKNQSVLSQTVSLKNDRQLEYLLKEKQLQKKIIDAKDEASQLRSLLQLAQQKLANSNLIVHEPSRNKTQTGAKCLSALRQKVENEGKMKRTLVHLSFCQLNNKYDLEQNQ